MGGVERRGHGKRGPQEGYEIRDSGAGGHGQPEWPGKRGAQGAGGDKAEERCGEQGETRGVFTTSVRGHTEFPSGRGLVRALVWALAPLTIRRPRLLSPGRSRPGSRSGPRVPSSRIGHVHLSVSPAARLSPRNPRCPLLELRSRPVSYKGKNAAGKDKGREDHQRVQGTRNRARLCA